MGGGGGGGGNNKKRSCFVPSVYLLAILNVKFLASYPPSAHVTSHTWPPNSSKSSPCVSADCKLSKEWRWEWPGNEARSCLAS